MRGPILFLPPSHPSAGVDVDLSEHTEYTDVAALLCRGLVISSLHLAPVVAAVPVLPKQALIGVCVVSGSRDAVSQKSKDDEQTFTSTGPAKLGRDDVIGST